MPDENPYAFLRADAWPEYRATVSDQQKRVPCPPLEEALPEGAQRLALPAPESFSVGELSVRESIRRRESRRRFGAEPVSLEQLAFLCWATQGVRSVAPSGAALLRTVPSGGSRHPFETYLIVHHVSGVEPGLYRYLSLSHELCLLRAGDLKHESVEACGGQHMASQCAAVFCWTALPYRTEWRYPIVASKLIALDAGHVCQNLYVAAESCNLGCCSIAAYNQQALDSLLGVDGDKQFAVYAAVVGRM